MIYKVAICDDEINQCAVLEKVIIEYFKNRAEKCEVITDIPFQGLNGNHDIHKICVQGVDLIL